MTECWQALRDKVIVKIKLAEEKSKGGILLLAKTKQEEDMIKEVGEIISVGSDLFGDSHPDTRDKLNIGDVVAFARYGGKTLEKEEEKGYELRVLRDIDVLAVKSEVKENE